MAVTYGFFNSINGDRKYNADQMSDYFRGIVNEGVFQHLNGGLAVVAGTGMEVTVATGRAIVQNKWVQNDAAFPLTIEAASDTYGRKDAVVIRLSYTNRNISIVVKTGTPAASPTAPSMTRNSTTYEMALAYVNVSAGATSVTVTDKRSDTTVCGWATVAQQTSGEVDAMLNDMKTGFDGVVYPSPGDAVRGSDNVLQGEIDDLKSALNNSMFTVGNALIADSMIIPSWKQGYYNINNGEIYLYNSSIQITTDPMIFPVGVDIHAETTKSGSGCSIREFAYVNGVLTRTRVIGNANTTSVTLEETIDGALYVIANINSSGTVPEDGEYTAFEVLSAVTDLIEKEQINESSINVLNSFTGYRAFDIDNIKTGKAYIYTGQTVIGENISSLITDNSNSYYLENSLDLSNFVGKTLRIVTNSYSQISTRFMGFCNASGLISSFYLERDLIWENAEGLYITEIPIDNTHFYFSLSKGASILYAQVRNANSYETAYISPTGSDSNDGLSASTPFATVQKAISKGFKNIILAPGRYAQQTVSISGIKNINMYCVGVLSEDTLIDDHVRKANAVIDNSVDITGLEAYNSIWKTALSVDNNSNYYKVFVTHALDLIYTAPDYYGRVDAYNAILWEETDDVATTKILVPVLTVLECEATPGTFTYDGTYLYINPYTGSITGRTFKRPYLESTTPGISIENSSNIRLSGIDVAYFTKFGYRVYKSENVEIQNAKSICTCYSATFKFDRSDAMLQNCSAIRSGVDGYGIEGVGNVSVFNCNAFYCNDDGISHHDEATGIIDGGEWAYCLKGGVTPSYGSRVTVKNVYAHHNVFGVYYIANETGRHTDTPLLLENSLMVDNTTKDLQVSNYNVVAFGCEYRTIGGAESVVGYGNTVIE